MYGALFLDFLKNKANEKFESSSEKNKENMKTLIKFLLLSWKKNFLLFLLNSSASINSWQKINLIKLFLAKKFIYILLSNLKSLLSE